MNVIEALLLGFAVPDQISSQTRGYTKGSCCCNHTPSLTILTTPFLLFLTPPYCSIGNILHQNNRESNMHPILLHSRLQIAYIVPDHLFYPHAISIGLEPEVISFCKCSESNPEIPCLECSEIGINLLLGPRSSSASLTAVPCFTCYVSSAPSTSYSIESQLLHVLKPTTSVRGCDVDWISEPGSRPRRV